MKKSKASLSLGRILLHLIYLNLTIEKNYEEILFSLVILDPLCYLKNVGPFPLGKNLHNAYRVRMLLWAKSFLFLFF